MISRPVRAGAMRERVVIQSLSTDRDSYGGEVDASDDLNWSEFWRCWGDLQPLTGRELQQAGQLQSEITAECRIRYRDGITEEMRLLQGTTIYDIRSVIDAGTAKRELVLGIRERK